MKENVRELPSKDTNTEHHQAWVILYKIRVRGYNKNLGAGTPGSGGSEFYDFLKYRCGIYPLSPIREFYPNTVIVLLYPACFLLSALPRFIYTCINTALPVIQSKQQNIICVALIALGVVSVMVALHVQH